MKLKLILLFSFLLYISISYSQEEITITQNYSQDKFRIENTITISDVSISFSNRYFTIIQTREEFAYLIYFHNIKSYWAGDAKSFDKEFYEYLYIIAESSDSTNENSDNIIKRMIKSNNAYFKNDSIVLVEQQQSYSKIKLTNKEENIANYNCKTIDYFIDTTLVLRTLNTNKLLSKATNDLGNLWHIINTLNKVLNTEVSINLSLVSNSKEYGYPMKTIFYNDNSSIQKEETVLRIEKHGISDCECYKYKEYQKYSLVDLLMGAESENKK